MNLLNLQNENKGYKGGARNLLGINNRLTGKKVSNFAAAEILDYPGVEETVQEYKVELKLVDNVVEDLKIMTCLLPEYKVIAKLADAYGVCIEAIEMAIESGDLVVTSTRYGYKAILNK